MIDLPPALAPWKDQLAIFPRDVALSIVPWLPRLALAVGPLRARSSTNTGTPDGFGGLARRGPYERLLLSEWLLASELPDEFTRRAAMGEHAFLELARREPAGSKRSIALFDAGPSQMGSPRLAHLALLVVLARRAKEAGASFGWGLLQNPDGWCYEDLTESSIIGLLEGRSTFDPTSADLEDWLDRLDTGEAPDDLWLVGSPRLGTLAPELSGSKLEIRDVLEKSARRVHIAVRRTRKIDGQVELELPDERACVRLLRDPFRVAAPAPAKPARTMNATSNLVFSPDGRKIFTRGGDGKVIVHRPPNSPRSSPGRTHLLTAADEQIVAAGVHGKDTYLISSDTAVLSVTGFSRRGRFRDLWKGVPIPQDFPFWHPGGRTPLEPCFIAPYAQSPQGGLLFLDAVGRLILLRATPPRRLELVEWGVTALARVRGKIVAAIDHVGGWAPDFRSEPEKSKGKGLRFAAVITPNLRVQPVGPPFELDCDGDLDAFFGYPGPLAHPDLGLLAARKNDRQWTIWDARGPQVIDVEEGTIVFGAAARPEPAYQSGLLVIEDDERTIRWIGKKTIVDITTTSSAIAFAAAGTSRPDFAYVLRNGELGVFSLEHGPLMYVRPSAPAREDDPEATEDLEVDQK